MIPSVATDVAQAATAHIKDLEKRIAELEAAVVKALGHLDGCFVDKEQVIAVRDILQAVTATSDK